MYIIILINNRNSSVIYEKMIYSEREKVLLSEKE